MISNLTAFSIGGQFRNSSVYSVSCFVFKQKTKMERGPVLFALLKAIGIASLARLASVRFLKDME